MRKIPKQKLILLIGDIIIINISILAAHFIRVAPKLLFGNLYQRIPPILFLEAMILISFYIFNLYDEKLNLKFSHTLSAVAYSIIMITIITSLFFYLFPYKLGRGVFFISLIILIILLIIWRLFFSSFFHLAVSKRNVLFLGPEEKAEIMHEILFNDPEYKLVSAIRYLPEESKCRKSIKDKSGNSLRTLIINNNINDIVISERCIQDRSLLQELIEFRSWGINVIDFVKFYEQIMYKLPLKEINEECLLWSNGFNRINRRYYDRMKRVVDLFVSFIILILSFPIGLLIALIIKLDSKGPIFFIQKRVGKNYRFFNIIKFRTMIVGAEKQIPQWTSKNDSRITRTGKFLRKTRLDELPQIINIIKGEMSLIGPRPEREYFVNKLTKEIPNLSLRFLIKPGLTGWAQVNYRYGSSLDDSREKLCYDVFYIKNMSLFLDMRIIFKTIRIVLLSQGR